MRVLITGANGLLGQKLIALLQQQPGVNLIATAQRPLVSALMNGEFHVLDISNQQQANLVISKTQPDVIINTAAMTNVDRCETEREACWQANVTSVEYLVEACKKNNIHLIHVSTDFIFDGKEGPLDESAIPAPVNFYGESKLAAEKLILASSISWCIVRTVLVYGVSTDMSRSNIVLWVKKSLEEGKTINVVNDQWRTPTLAEDLAMGCWLAAQKKAKGIYHVSGKDFLSPFDIAVQTAHYFNLDESLIKPTDSTQFKQPARRPLKTGFIIAKAQKELGYAPHGFSEGLAVLQSQLKN
ncbi:MAG: NAD(P)-dependent oxidoreductase [Cyclobacteriaceae bacterium]|nr:NAD(P)-dependent oxidoreductase [Cyclobacteriaceae bacterium]UYN86027.1 MAG: NAD(P)-dependent oxidoreductase [Cyclobacteriaceae bacterium]